MQVITSRGQTFTVYEMSDLPESGEDDNMTIGNCCSSYNGACPEIVPVTIEERSFIMDGDILFGDVTFGYSGIDKISAQVPFSIVDSEGDPVTEIAEVNIRFVDRDTDLGTPSAFGPTTPGWTHKIVITDEDGEYVLNVEYSGAYREWYVVVTYLGKPNLCPEVLNLGI